jgi:hypothetical protein
MYRLPTILALLQWHHSNHLEPDVRRLVVDSLAWVHINDKFPEFAAKLENLRFGLKI